MPSSREPRLIIFLGTLALISSQAPLAQADDDKVGKVIHSVLPTDARRVEPLGLAAQGKRLSIVARVDRSVDPTWMLHLDAQGTATGPYVDNELVAQDFVPDAAGGVYVFGRIAKTYVIRHYDAEGFQLRQDEITLGTQEEFPSLSLPTTVLVLDQTTSKPVVATAEKGCLVWLSEKADPQRTCGPEPEDGQTTIQTIRSIIRLPGSTSALVYADLTRAAWATRTAKKDDVAYFESQARSAEQYAGSKQRAAESYSQSIASLDTNYNLNPHLHGTGNYTKNYQSNRKRYEELRDAAQKEATTWFAEAERWRGKKAKPVEFVQELEHGMWFAVATPGQEDFTNSVFAAAEVSSPNFRALSEVENFAKRQRQLLSNVAVFATADKISVAGLRGSNRTDIYHAILDPKHPTRLREREIEMAESMRKDTRLFSTARGIFALGHDGYQQTIYWLRAGTSGGGIKHETAVVLTGVPSGVPAGAVILDGDVYLLTQKDKTLSVSQVRLAAE